MDNSQDRSPAQDAKLEPTSQLLPPSLPTHHLLSQSDCHVKRPPWPHTLFTHLLCSPCDITYWQRKRMLDFTNFKWHFSLENWAYFVSSWNTTWNSIWIIIPSFVYNSSTLGGKFFEQTKQRPLFGSLPHPTEYIKAAMTCVGEKKNNKKKPWWILHKEIIEMTSDFKIFQPLLNGFHPLDWPGSLGSIPLHLLFPLNGSHIIFSSLLASHFYFIRVSLSAKPSRIPQIPVLLWYTLTVTCCSLILTRRPTELSPTWH